MALLLFILAISSEAVFAVNLASMVVNLIIAIIVLWFARADRFAEKAEQLIDAKIANKFGELAGAIREQTTEIRNIKERLSDGEGEFDKLGERDQKLELALKDHRRELERWMMETFASKKDVELYASRVDELGSFVHGMKRKAAV